MTNSKIAMSMAMNHGLPLSTPMHDNNSTLSKIHVKKTKRVSAWNPFGNGPNLRSQISRKNASPDRGEVIAMLLEPHTENAKIGRRKTLDAICKTSNSSQENNLGMNWEEVRKILRKEGITTNVAILQFLHHRKSLWRKNNGCSTVCGTKCDVLSTIGVSLLPINELCRKKQKHQPSPSLKARTQELIMEHTRQLEIKMKINEENKRKRVNPSISPFVSQTKPVLHRPSISNKSAASNINEHIVRSKIVPVSGDPKTKSQMLGSNLNFRINTTTSTYLKRLRGF